jgi:hypothetical protein
MSNKLRTSRTGKINSVVRAQVVNGIARGWTAKETSYNTGISLGVLRHTAKKLDLAFIWTKAGPPPGRGSQRVPVKTLLRRDKHTIDTVLTELNKLVKLIPADSPRQIEVIKLLSFVRLRRNPPRWINRVA